ncbi:transcription termination factor 3, mitochondrial [Bradysia coprophila]|uniref:transcription termination factor 3, mitochondrial n=1 Tax=Bradysia coprophila TaxID=38358 RepID=UPI00187D7186|nr:transcription termination factor 3, mitochondrial [Bradysia coprophila]
MRNLLQTKFINQFQTVIKHGMCSKALTAVADKTVANDKVDSKDKIDWMEELRELDNRSVLDAPVSKDLYKSSTPALSPTFNLAAYVNESETLQQLIKLGVDLSKIERRKGLSQFVLKLDFEKDVKNHITFLHQECGLPMEAFGSVLTKNPLIFKESLLDLETRVTYLKSKLFKPVDIARIAEKNPFWLMFRTQRIDRRLGFFQKKFDLLGSQVRALTVKQPRLITYHLQSVERNAFSIREEFGFSSDETRMLVLQTPRILMMNQHNLLGRLDYIHNTMGISHEQIVKSSGVLQSREHIIRQRHEFLKLIGRAQYDPTKDLYVSLIELVVGTDQEFALNVAGTSYIKFETFLRQL